MICKTSKSLSIRILGAFLAFLFFSYYAFNLIEASRFVYAEETFVFQLNNGDIYGEGNTYKEAYDDYYSSGTSRPMNTIKIFKDANMTADEFVKVPSGVIYSSNGESIFTLTITKGNSTNTEFTCNVSHNYSNIYVIADSGIKLSMLQCFMKKTVTFSKNIHFKAYSFNNYTGDLSFLPDYNQEITLINSTIKINKKIDYTGLITWADSQTTILDIDKNCQFKANNSKSSSGTKLVITGKCLVNGQQPLITTIKLSRVSVPSPFTLERDADGIFSISGGPVDESSEIPDESSVAPDESSQANDESSVAPDESSQANDESSVSPDESSQSNDESSVAPDESSQANDESSVAPDESSQANDESSVAPDESSQINDESSVAPDESSQANDESSVAPDESSQANAHSFPLIQENPRASDESSQLINESSEIDNNKNDISKNDIPLDNKEDSNISNSNLENVDILNEEDAIPNTGKTTAIFTTILSSCVLMYLMKRYKK